MRKKLTIISALFFLAVILIYFSFSLSGEDILYSKNIVINEVCSSNLSSFLDERGEHPDWAELYNKGNRDMDISGWKLSDSAGKRDLWSFPEGTVIPAGSYLIVFLDGRGKEGGLYAPFKLNSDSDSLYLSSKALNPIDSVNIPKLKYDTVWARETDGGKRFTSLTPTPLDKNEKGAPVILSTLKEPEFSRGSGFYSEGFDLTLSSEEGEIHYTLDGSDPDPSSPLYTGPIEIRDRNGKDNVYSADKNVSVDLLSYMENVFTLPKAPVDKCTVVRAAVFDKEGNSSESVTRSYFIGFDKKKAYDGIGVISLVSDPEGLFSYEKGIYVIGEKGVSHFREKIAASENAVKFLEENPGTPDDGSVPVLNLKMTEYTESNYMQSGSLWERPVSLEIFNDSHDLSESLNAGLRIKGHRTRNFPKKSLNIFGRELYGETGKRGDFSLFTGGNDMISMLRDPFISELTKDLSFASPDFSGPLFLFLDGEFWGLYRISSKQDASFLNERFGINEVDAVVIKNSLLSVGTEEDFSDFWSFKEYIENADLSDPEEYEHFKTLADIDSIIDYFGARVYLEEGIDWPNTNTALWKTREVSSTNPYADGRWRWLNFDNNLNIHYDSVSFNTIDMVVNGSKGHKRNEMMHKLFQNPDFRKRFKERFTEITETVFDPSVTLPLLDRYASEIRPYVEADYKRYYGDNYSVSDFDKDVEEMRLYLKERASYMLDYVREACE